MPSFAGLWHNEYNSEMDLSVDASGVVTGTYITHVPIVSPPMRLYGCVYGDLITFFVKWEDASQGIDWESITSWVGQLAPDLSGTEILQSLWHITQEIPDADEPLFIYKQILTGADMFTRGAAPVTPHPVPLMLHASHPVFQMKHHKAKKSMKKTAKPKMKK